MSDEDRDVDIESDDDDDDSLDKNSGELFSSQADKRAHHNALERKRRDHIKDSFHNLRDSIPTLHGEKASRALILKKAADYIQVMKRKNNGHQQDIDDLRTQNQLLEQQIRSLEKSPGFTGKLENPAFTNVKGEIISAFDGGSASDSSDSDPTAHQQPRRKRVKISSSSSTT